MRRDYKGGVEAAVQSKWQAHRVRGQQGSWALAARGAQRCCSDGSVSSGTLPYIRFIPRVGDRGIRAFLLLIASSLRPPPYTPSQAQPSDPAQVDQICRRRSPHSPSPPRPGEQVFNVYHPGGYYRMVLISLLITEVSRPWAVRGMCLRLTRDCQALRALPPWPPV